MEISMEQLQQLLQIAARTGAQAALAVITGDQASIVRNAAKAGADALKHEQAIIRRNERKRSYNRRLYNTRLLLKNYRMLKDHFQNAIYTFKNEQDNSDDIKPGDIWKLLNDESQSEEVYIESICKSATRTMIILQHLDRMLGLYEAFCDRSPMPGIKRQYRILKMYYLDDPQISMSDIADMEHIHRRTAERDLDAAVECLTALIFGIDAIKDLTGGYQS